MIRRIESSASSQSPQSVQRSRVAGLPPPEPARDVLPSTTPTVPPRGKRGRKPLESSLRREVVRHELAASEPFCAHDGKDSCGMPRYRHATLLRRFGSDRSSNTRAPSGVHVGGAVPPAIGLTRDASLETDLSGADDPTCQVLNEAGRGPQVTSALWAQVNGSDPPVRRFSSLSGRRAQHAQRQHAGVPPGGCADDRRIRTRQKHRPGAPVRASRIDLSGCRVPARRGAIEAEVSVAKVARPPTRRTTCFTTLSGTRFAAEARSATCQSEHSSKHGLPKT